MGQAKRRKDHDTTYGLPSVRVKISVTTQKALIVLCAQSQEMIISAHIKPETLQAGILQCNRCITTFSKADWQNFDVTLDRFMQRLVQQFDYPDEDEILGVYSGEQFNSLVKT